MNFTNFFDKKQIVNAIENSTFVAYLVIFSILILCFLILLPFYVYVNKVNKVRDKSTLVFPITNHFYEMNKATYFIFLYLISSIIATIVLFIYQSSLAALGIVSFFLMALALYIIIQVFYLLLALLAIQRLLIYFIPSVENQLAKTLKTIHTYIWYIYILFTTKEVFGLIFVSFCALTECKPQKFLMFKIVYTSTFLFLNLLLITSAFLYIPITWSVWKLSNFTISKQNRPQKYIFFQMIIILIFKFLCIPAMLLFLYYESSLSAVMFFVAATDIVIIPLIIEISYLGCNKRNIDILFRNFSLIKFFKVLLDINNESTVQPQITFTNFSGYSASAL
ncbi:hypothetical protein CAEBREN_10366 [Caenorhabditis brenneri]|uniref:Serpentine Receptor, class Z n=1 Tax=Caenorhabditis brenneri TaxID=135651 RepID=G0NQ77_CAEBE|nr:hypothetical protein CAEBREN_10366 [Caenorhabditis brenneri]